MPHRGSHNRPIATTRAASEAKSGTRGFGGFGDVPCSGGIWQCRRSENRLYQELIAAEAAAFIGVAPYELSFFPPLLEHRRRVDQALFAVVIEAYVHGVSTRKVEGLVASTSEMCHRCPDTRSVTDALRQNCHRCPETSRGGSAETEGFELRRLVSASIRLDLLRARFRGISWNPVCPTHSFSGPVPHGSESFVGTRWARRIRASSRHTTLPVGPHVNSSTRREPSTGCAQPLGAWSRTRRIAGDG